MAFSALSAVAIVWAMHRGLPETLHIKNENKILYQFLYFTPEEVKIHA